MILKACHQNQLDGLLSKFFIETRTAKGEIYKKATRTCFGLLFLLFMSFFKSSSDNDAKPLLSKDICQSVCPSFQLSDYLIKQLLTIESLDMPEKTCIDLGFVSVKFWYSLVTSHHVQ